MKKKSVLILFIIIFSFWNCSKKDTMADAKLLPALDTEVSIEDFIYPNKGDFGIGENVTLNAFAIKNISATKVSITSVIVRVINFKEPNKSVHTFELAKNIEIPVNNSYTVASQDIISIPSDFQKDSYGIYIDVKFIGGAIKKFYKTFFRVTDPQTLLTYNIGKEDYQGLSVFKLRGGLSAEYSIQKSVATFVSGISHTWTTPIETVASTPDFLERSINSTIDFYNEVIGDTAPIENIIISTGIPGVQYLARNMKAIVLPVHYLVASGTVKEAQTILEHANNTGYSAYGTIGHDFSITNTQSVGWIKLLELPSQYKKFINDHQVKNVILLGHTGTNDGETEAQKVTDSRGEYEKGSLYLMRFSGDASDGYLKQILSDYNTTQLSNVSKVADWEAGIITEQIDNFSNVLKAETSVSVATITANDGVHLWNLGTYTALSLMQKNKAAFEVDGPVVRGISTNQYLLGNPGYESYIRYVPFLYFAGFSAEFQYDNWLSTKIKTAINNYFPDIVFEDLTFWTNDASMDTLLKSKGLTVRSSNYQEGQLWDTSNGLNSLTEVRAVDIINKNNSFRI